MSSAVLRRSWPVVLMLVATSIARALTVMDEGELAHHGTTECGAHRGAVVVRTGVHVVLSENERGEIVEHPDAVSIAFVSSQGSAVECRWVQFVWTEVVATVELPNGQRGTAKVPGRIRTTGGPVELTTDPTAPRWAVDSAGTSPAYDSRGASFTDAKGSRIFDQPGNVAQELGPLLNPPPGGRIAHVEDVKHFEAVLTCDGRVCRTVTWTQRCTWTPPAPGVMGPPATSMRYDPPATSRAGGAILPEQRAALDREHPGQRVVPPG